MHFTSFAVMDYYRMCPVTKIINNNNYTDENIAEFIAKIVF